MQLTGNRAQDISFFKAYIEKELGVTAVIKDIIEIDNNILVLHDDASYSNPYNDERLARTGGIGPLRVNKLSGEMEFMHAVDYVMTYAERKELKHLFTPEPVTYEKLVSNAIARKHINWSDFADIFTVKGLEIPVEMSIYGDACRILLKVPVLTVEDINNEDAQIIEAFLKDINANFEVKENNVFLVHVDIL